MEFRDYYAVLGVDKKASAEDIKRAYRKLARQYHPDVNPGDKSTETKFKEINEAHEVLGDPEKRRKYDELGANWRAYEQQAASGDASRGAWRSSGGTYRTISPDELQDLFGRGDPFSDFFYTFFGGGGGSGFANDTGGAARSRATRRSRRGADIETQTDLTLEEVFTGTSRRVQMSQGDRPRTLEVRIPAGVPDGARVRASGEGAPGSGDGAAGDLYVVVRVLPHARFERKGQDLQTRVPVPVTTAVLGGEATVSTLGGTTLRLKIPPLTSTGRVFRLRGHGLPVVGRPDERGDLYATIDVAIPSTLSDEERAHYEALKGLAGKEDRP